MSSSGVLDVSRKKPDPIPEPQKPDASLYGPSKPIIVQMRGSLAFKEWIKGLSKHDRSSIPDMIERLLVSHARAIGFTEPPPER
jgi:hypothetical protein